MKKLLIFLAFTVLLSVIAQAKTLDQKKDEAPKAEAKKDEAPKAEAKKEKN